MGGDDEPRELWCHECDYESAQSDGMFCGMFGAVVLVDLKEAAERRAGMVVIARF